MRAVALSLVLTLPALSGCLQSGDDLEPASDVPALPAEAIEAPAGAQVEATPEGALVTWLDVALPFREDLAIPAGVTMVRLTAEVGSGAVTTSMLNSETGRRRCNPSYVDNAWVNRLGRMTCSGLTAMDDLPATWTLVATSVAAKADLVQVELLTTRPDGVAGLLNLSALSKPVFDLLPTEDVTIDSFDGTALYGQLTRPDADAPVPVIISSSPYNGPSHAAGAASMWTYFVQDWAMRGYAVLSADVRGTGRSGGCMEVWSANEQRDQVSLVEWAATRPWSDGRVGFYGQSYVGTTPVAAAVQAPEALKAIVTVAPVNNAYDDWHFGGVPNGENQLSPVFYQASTGGVSDVEPSDPLASALQAANGVCDPTLAARANDPRAVYDAFYVERNFSARAGDVRAAVLYTQGFEDTNVKSAMITHWFNALAGPKLGLFGHWIHQHPTRMDQEVLFLAWMDQYVKGLPLGLETVPAVSVLSNAGTHRYADAWPPVSPGASVLFPDFGAASLGPEPSDGDAMLVTKPVSTPLGSFSNPVASATYVLEGDVTTRLPLTGGARLQLRASLSGAENAHVAAFLYDGDQQVTFGMANLAHRNGHDRYDPVAPGEQIVMDLPFLPTEYVFEPGDRIRLELRAAHVDDWSLVGPAEPGILTVRGGAEGTALVLPTVALAEYGPIPLTAQT